MAKIAALPSPPPGVRSALDACPAAARAAVTALRALIIETAADLPEVGPLTETLKWGQQYGDQLTFIGNREISIPTHTDLPRAPLQHCIAMALTYHSRKIPS